MIFSRLFKADAAQLKGRDLYEAAVQQARQPVFYAELGIPDTLDGRFEAILLHVWLVLRRIRLANVPTDALSVASGKVSQAVFDSMIGDMDRSLREMGVGDLRVGKRVKAMAKSFYGHVQAYDAGLEGSTADLTAALRRNVYGTSELEAAALDGAVDGLVQYVEKAVSLLDNQPIEAIIDGKVTFGAPNRGESR